MQYDIDSADTESGRAAHCTTLAWAVRRGDRFVMGVEESIYDDPSQLARLLTLGAVTAAPEPSDRLGRLLAKTFDKDFVLVKGRPGTQLVAELTSLPPPARARAGEICSVDYITLYDGDRALYTCYDYGTVQIVDLAADELESLRLEFVKGGLDPGRIVPAPEPRIFGNETPA